MTEKQQGMDYWKYAVRLGFIAYWITLFVSTHIPIDPDFGIPGKDKTLHFVGYGLLGALLMMAVLSRRRTASPFVLWLGLWGIVAGYGAFDELTQPLAGRHCDFTDWLADLGGSALGLALAWAIVSRFQRRIGTDEGT